MGPYQSFLERLLKGSLPIRRAAPVRAAVPTAAAA